MDFYSNLEANNPGLHLIIKVENHHMASCARESLKRRGWAKEIKLCIDGILHFPCLLCDYVYKTIWELGGKGNFVLKTSWKMTLLLR